VWRPPQRIRYTAAAGRMPSAAEAAASVLFSPIDIGPVRLEQRTWVPAMVPWRATEEGDATDEVVDWYERFARGMPGAIVVEATGIRDVPSGPLLRIGHDRFLPGLRRLVEAVRRTARKSISCTKRRVRPPLARRTVSTRRRKPGRKRS
jgi:2,4-dienoyl-CoA reductase-like NADH-dependent reductase (Old Yellow Enzyme family)